MSTEIPAGGGEQKPVVKNNEGKQHGGNRRNKPPFLQKREKFEGATAELSGYIFTAGANRTAQLHNFTRTVERIKTYVGQNFDPHMLQSLEEVKEVLPTQPTPTLEADGSMSKTNEIIFNKEIAKWIDVKYVVQKELKNAYSVVYGQCDEEMKASLAMDPTFEAIDKSKDVIGLYKLLQKINFSYTPVEEPILTMFKAKQDFMRIRQYDGQSVTEYYEKFLAMKEVNETLGTNIYDDLGFVEVIAREKGKDLDAMTPGEKDQFSTDAMEEGSDRMMSIHLLLGANQGTYGDLLTDLKNQFLKDKKNEYPKRLHDAYTLLKGWSKGRQAKNPNKVGVSFNTNGDEEGDVMVNNGDKQACERCGRTNHPTKDCFAKKRQDGTLLHTEAVFSTGDEGSEVSNVLYADISTNAYGLMFLYDSPTGPNTSSKGGIPNTWILLDSQSTIDVFSSAKLLINIYRSTTTMHIKCNAGSKSTNLRGTLPGYGEVWYFAEGIANILSLSRVKERFRVTYDSAADNSFLVHKPDKILRFREATQRLYYFDTAERGEVGTILVTTVKDNMTKFSAYDISKAKLARSVQQCIGRPSTQDYIRFVRENHIPNCPVTVQDIKNAELIWGPDLGSLKGKTVRHKSPVVKVESSTIPLAIMQEYRDVTLSIDVMKVNGVPFLNTISQHIKFGSAGKLDNLKNFTIIKHLQVIFGVYTVRGFRVTIILADNQFESMRGDIANLGAIVNVVSRDEHVPEIERYNRTIKDRVRSQYTMLPFKYVPPIVIIELVYSQVFWRNMFALRGGVSNTQSPSEIILNRKVDINAHCKIEFGEYVQTHEEHDNSMNTRTVGAIATRPTGNTQGGYYFIRLDTGCRINRKDWTSLSMPAAVIDQVHRLARRANAKRELSFTNLQNENLDESYANIPGIDDVEPDALHNDDHAGIAGVDVDDEDANDSDYNPENEDDDSNDGDEDSNDENDNDDDSNDGGDIPEIPGMNNNDELMDEENAGVSNNDKEEEETAALRSSFGTVF
jgi:hypothetical protein